MRINRAHKSIDLQFTEPTARDKNVGKRGVKFANSPFSKKNKKQKNRKQKTEKKAGFLCSPSLKKKIK
jgi:hypothetical protein